MRKQKKIKLTFQKRLLEERLHNKKKQYTQEIFKGDRIDSIADKELLNVFTEGKKQGDKLIYS